MALIFALGATAPAQSITRAEVLRTAESYLHHRWQSSAKNVRHGKDAAGIEVHTPDRDSGYGTPPENCWRVDASNVGVAYKWGGMDTPATFDLGIKAGLAAGDIYTDAKRRLDEKAVSKAAVGVDCSGFICRCWQLKKRYSTYSLGRVCRKLSSVDELKPGDVLNQRRGHVVMFAKWVDRDDNRALFYEAWPTGKTVAYERHVNRLLAEGFVPMRYKHIRD